MGASWDNWIPWSQRILDFEAERNLRERATDALISIYASRKIWMVDNPRNSNQTRYHSSKSRRIDFYIIEVVASEAKLHCVTPLIYALLSGRKSTEETHLKGMIIPLVNVDVEEWMGSEISNITGVKWECEWIRPVPIEKSTIEEETKK